MAVAQWLVCDWPSRSLHSFASPSFYIVSPPSDSQCTRDPLLPLVYIKLRYCLQVACLAWKPQLNNISNGLQRQLLAQSLAISSHHYDIFPHKHQSLSSKDLQIGSWQYKAARAVRTKLVLPLKCSEVAVLEQFHVSLFWRFAVARALRGLQLQECSCWGG